MYLRTTTSATNNTMLDFILTNQSKYREISAQASTQKKIMTPSDNPTGAISVLNINKQLSQLDGYVNNMAQSQNELNVLDTSLASMTKNLQRVNDLAVQAADGTNSSESLNSIKIEVDQIIKGMTQLGNTQFNGSYIFAGTNVTTLPFQEIPTGGVSYNGTPQDKDYQRYIQISDGVDVAINVSGDQLLGSYDADATGTPPVPTGSGILKTLYEFSNSLAVSPTDFDAIRSNIDKIQSGIQNVSNFRTNFASITQRFDMTKSSIDSNVLQLKSFRSDLQDVDLAEVMTNLSNQELALRATMAVAAQNQQVASLLNYM